MEDKLVQTSDTSRTFSKLQTPDGKRFCDGNNLRRLTINNAKINDKLDASIYFDCFYRS